VSANVVRDAVRLIVRNSSSWSWKEGSLDGSLVVGLFDFLKFFVERRLIGIRLLVGLLFRILFFLRVRERVFVYLQNFLRALWFYTKLVGLRVLRILQVVEGSLAVRDRFDVYMI
jgi:hypothetical protein